MDSEFNSFDIAYDNFLKNFITYQELFDSSATPQDISELPYCLFNDLINAQIARKKELEKLKNKELQQLQRQRQR